MKINNSRDILLAIRSLLTLFRNRKGIIFLFSLLFSQIILGQPDPENMGKTGTTRSRALVVGISNYEHLKPLNYADDDARLFAHYLYEQKICEQRDITLLVDSVATEPAFYRELNLLLASMQKGERLYLYFSGHGDVETTIQSGYLLTYNCEPNNYTAYAIEISTLEKYLNAFVAKGIKVMLLTDACRSGNLAGGLNGAATTLANLTTGFQNIIKLLSCEPDQLSIEKYFPDGGHGVFTYHLVDGLSGLADADNNGMISVRELKRYLDTVAIETDGKQSPTIIGKSEELIVRYNDTIKKALLTRKAGLQTQTGIVRTKSSDTDSAWLKNSFYRSFINHLRKRKLISPVDGNAYQVLQDAENKQQDQDMLFEMRLTLAASLEDESNKFISKYIRGELEIDENKIINELNLAYRYLETIDKIIDKKDFRNDDLKVKKVFFQAFIIYRLAQKESYQRAIELLTEAIKIRKGQAWLYNLAGMFYAETKEYKLAEAYFKDAVQFSPTWAYPWYNLGHLYQDMNNDSAAIVFYEKSISLDSGFSLPFNNLGLLYQKQNKYTEAEVLFRKAIQSDSSIAGSWLNYGNLLFAMNILSLAEDAYMKTIKLSNNYVYVWNYIGLIHVQNKLYEKAEQAYKKVIEIYPDWSTPWYNLSTLYKLLGKTRESEKADKKAKEIDYHNLRKEYPANFFKPRYWNY